MAINNVTFDDLVCQESIITEEDKLLYGVKGYIIPYTKETFTSTFNINPARVFYTPSLTLSSVYVNFDTMAVCSLHLEAVGLGGASNFVKQIETAVAYSEKEVEEHDFLHSILPLPDAMRFDYLKRLRDKYPDFDGLYSLFMSVYLDSDYGFGVLDDGIARIIGSKSCEDIEKTKVKISNLPNKVKVYRGGNSGSVSYFSAYSWTRNRNVAYFFAARRGNGPGYIAEGYVNKNDIVEYFPDDRNEDEVIINPNKIQIEKVTELVGFDFLESIVPAIGPMFNEYCEELDSLDFASTTAEHGSSHEKRVLFLSLALAHRLNLSIDNKRILATASIFHDTQRTNDMMDSSHGRNARKYYDQREEEPDAIVEFLCEFHCLPDSDGYAEIERNPMLSQRGKEIKQLFEVFKDADALDRVRFGDLMHEPDIKQLRLDVSKGMVLAARILCSQL